MNYSGERFLPEECSGEIAVEHYQRYVFARQLVEGKIVLDAACGEGYGSKIISEAASRVYGLDISQETVELANEKYGSANVSFIQGDVAKLPFEDKAIDVVLSFETIEHISEDLQRKFLKEIKRVLTADGVLVVSTPNKAIYTDLVEAKNQFHMKEFYLQEFEEFLKIYFANITFFYQYPDVAYFITEESKESNVSYCGIKGEKSRYFIALCSDNNCYKNDIRTKQIVKFDNSMYYQLNKLTHKQERDLRQVKEEAELFQTQQEISINAQKKYIQHLEHDITIQQEAAVLLENNIDEKQKYISRLEGDIAGQAEYIVHVEKDITEQKEAIALLEKNLIEQKSYTVHLERDIGEQGEYIAHLEENNSEQREYIAHLEKDIGEQKEYIAHLERDISVQKEYIEQLEEDVKTSLRYIFKRGKKNV